MTSAERKRKERIAKRKSGLVPKEVWTTPKAWPRIKAYIERATIPELDLPVTSGEMTCEHSTAEENDNAV